VAKRKPGVRILLSNFKVGELISLPAPDFDFKVR